MPSCGSQTQMLCPSERRCMLRSEGPTQAVALDNSDHRVSPVLFPLAPHHSARKCPTAETCVFLFPWP